MTLYYRATALLMPVPVVFYQALGAQWCGADTGACITRRYSIKCLYSAPRSRYTASSAREKCDLVEPAVLHH